MTSTSDVCSQPGAGSAPAELVRVIPEAAGANCANGGVAIESGADSNADG